MRDEKEHVYVYVCVICDMYMCDMCVICVCV